MFQFDDNQYYGQTFNDLDLSQQVLDDIEFESCIFNHCNFSDVILKRCKLIDCGFNDCNMANMNPSYTQFHDVSFNQSKVSGVDWTRVSWSGLMVDSPLEFINCVVSFSSFFGLKLTSMRMEACQITEVDFRQGDFSNGIFLGSDFSGSLFGATNLSQADFTDAGNYNIDIRTCNVEHAIFSRFEAVRLLEIIGIEIVD